MQRIIQMRNLLIAVLIFLASCEIGYGATSYTAATCSQANVQTAVTSCTNDGQCVQVNIPSGSCTWSNSSITIPKAMKIQGAGAANTILTGTSGFFSFGTSGIEITGIGFTMGSGIFITIYGGQNWRVHNNSFTGTSGTSGDYAVLLRTSNFSNPPFGLIDNNTFSNSRVYVSRCISQGWNCNVEAYYEANSFGNENYVFIEDNTVTFTRQSNWIDGNDAGKWVARFNTLTDSEIMCHGVGYETGVRRGTKAWEIYNNSFTATGAPMSITPIFLRSGTGLIFNNTISGTWTWTNSLLISSDRSLNEYYRPCDGTSPRDGNTSGQSGWLCRDQVGAGRDTVKQTYNSSGFTSWPAQASEPVYGWGNTTAIVPNGISYVHIQEDRDYYDGGTWGVQTSTSSPFNGTSGVGRGTFANRPSTCTTGVAYWATDRGGNWNTINADANDGCLYKCTSTNTWSPTCSYTPYTYPHPLRTGGYIPPEDTTPPVILTSSPSGNIEYSATKTITLQTNENANCTFCTAGGTCDADASFTEVFVLSDFAWMTNTGGTTHSMTINVEPSTEYSYYFSCRDISANQNAMTGVSPYAPRLVNFTTGASGGGDSNAPVMSNPLPSGAVYPCGSNVTLQVDATDDSGTVSGCRYNATDVAYASMSGTFDAPGGIPTSQVTDSYDVSATLALEISGNAAHRTEAGKSFTATIAGTLDNIRFRLGKYGSPTGNVTVKVYAHSGTYGTSSIPTGDALATSDNVAASGIGTSNAFVAFTFSGANRISLEEGTYYVATVAYSGGDASNYIRIYRESTVLGHSGNDVRNDSGSWGAYTTREAPFYVTVIQGGSGSFSDTLTAPTCGQSYTYYYRCTDGSNANTSSQTATFTIAGGVCPIAGCIEFEDGTNASPMIEYTDAAASGGQYIATTTDLQGTSTHSVVIGTAGTYRIIARVNAADRGTDSIFLAIDGGDAVMLALNYSFAEANWNTWREEALHSLVNNAWTEYHVTLTADTHSFVFTGRETGAKLDYFYLDRIEGPLPPHIGTTRFMIGTGQTMVVAPTTGGCQVIIE